MIVGASMMSQRVFPKTVMMLIVWTFPFAPFEKNTNMFYFYIITSEKHCPVWYCNNEW